MIHRLLSLEGPSLGTVAMPCAHCGGRQPLERYRLMTRLPDGSGAFQEGEGLLCPACGKVSRSEGVAGRIVALIFLVPFAALLAAGVATGLWFLGAMIFGAGLDVGFAVVAGILIGVAGWALWRVVRSIARVAHPRRALPLEGLLTDIR